MVRYTRVLDEEGQACIIPNGAVQVIYCEQERMTAVTRTGVYTVTEPREMAWLMGNIRLRRDDE